MVLHSLLCPDLIHFKMLALFYIKFVQKSKITDSGRRQRSAAAAAAASLEQQQQQQQTAAAATILPNVSSSLESHSSSTALGLGPSFKGSLGPAKGLLGPSSSSIPLRGKNRANRGWCSC